MKTFSFETVENFDKHIDESIEGYAQLDRLVKSVSSYFVKPGTTVYDLGCSTGRLLRDLGEVHGDSAKYVGIDKCDNFAKMNEGPAPFEYRKELIEDISEYPNASMIVSMFTLQFIDPRHREKILRAVYDSLPTGGAFIMAEKVYSTNAKIQDILTFQYYDYKSKSFSGDEILSKERDLRKIMFPLSAKENDEFLERAGFDKREVFWRSYNFLAYICVK